MPDAHSAFNILCTVFMLPLSGFLEKLVCRLLPDAKRKEEKTELDERLLATPSIALERCREVAAELAKTSVEVLKDSLTALKAYTPALAEKIREGEERTDHFEDILGTYLVHLSTRQIREADSTEAAELLKVIGDFERIADHGVNLLQSAEEMREKGVTFTDRAAAELETIFSAVREILDLSLAAFPGEDLTAAEKVEPLEPGDRSSQGEPALQPHSPSAAGELLHGRRIYLVGPADEPRTHCRSLLQHCRMRDRYRSQ